MPFTLINPFTITSIRRRNNSPSQSTPPQSRRSSSARRTSLSFPQIFTFKSHHSSSTSSSRSPSPSRHPSSPSPPPSFSTNTPPSTKLPVIQATSEEGKNNGLRSETTELRQELSDAETWEKMLDMQMEYHCYNSARLEAAVEAKMCGASIDEIARPSRLCLDLLNDELRNTMEGERSRG